MRGENKLLKALNSMLVDEVSTESVALLRRPNSCSSTPPRNRLHLCEAAALLKEQLRPGRDPQPQISYSMCWTAAHWGYAAPQTLCSRSNRWFSGPRTTSQIKALW